MERIQQAIEKARKQRESGSGSSLERGAGNSLTEDATRAEDLVDTFSNDNAEAKNPETIAPQTRGEKLEQRERANIASGEVGSSIRIKYSRTRTISLSEKELKERFIFAGFAHDKRAEPYRQLRSQILPLFRQNNWRTLAVTSPNKESGSTLTAINLAVSLSLEANQTVLLVDLNLRSPGVADSFGFGELEAGIVDCIRGDCGVEDALLNPGFERLVVLPGKPHSAFTSEILSSPEMRSLKRELETRYPSRIIIFDLPPVLDNDDALVFAPECDATLMVIEEGGTKKQELERAYELLAGSNVIGSVLNKVRYLS
ncbi:MAG: CpsD/CapB family tyrosine-protein kinase [Pseudomonadales bacterium]